VTRLVLEQMPADLVDGVRRSQPPAADDDFHQDANVKPDLASPGCVGH